MLHYLSHLLLLGYRSHRHNSASYIIQRITQRIYNSCRITMNISKVLARCSPANHGFYTPYYSQISRGTNFRAEEVREN